MSNIKRRTYKRCTILVREDVYQRLSNEGRFRESFSDLISRLLGELDLKRSDNVRAIALKALPVKALEMQSNEEIEMLASENDLAIHPPAASGEVQ
jgi:predicted CopG family antitoxin